MFNATRRLSALPELRPPSLQDRRPSVQDMADSALHFLEKRRSSDQGIGSIQPDLYRKRGSVVRNESSSGSPPVGTCDLQMRYDFSRSDFYVSILEARNLIDSEEYAIILSISGCNQIYQTGKFVKGSPFRREDFKFALGFDELLDKSLIVQLICYKKTGGSHIIGETTIKLSRVDPSDEVFLTTDIDMNETKDNLGKLFLGLQYLPSAERLIVTVHQGKDLPCKDSLPTAYVKVFLLHSGRILKKRKTAVRKNSQSPVWNEALNFTISPQLLSGCHLEIDILDYDRVGNNKLMGQIMFSSDSCDRMWKDILQGKTVHPKWIPLRFT